MFFHDKQGSVHHLCCLFLSTAAQNPLVAQAVEEELRPLREAGDWASGLQVNHCKCQTCSSRGQRRIDCESSPRFAHPLRVPLFLGTPSSIEHVALHSGQTPAALMTSLTWSKQVFWQPLHQASTTSICTEAGIAHGNCRRSSSATPRFWLR